MCVMEFYLPRGKTRKKKKPSKRDPGVDFYLMNFDTGEIAPSEQVRRCGWDQEARWVMTGVLVPRNKLKKLQKEYRKKESEKK